MCAGKVAGYFPVILICEGFSSGVESFPLRRSRVAPNGRSPPGLTADSFFQRRAVAEAANGSASRARLSPQEGGGPAGRTVADHPESDLPTQSSFGSRSKRRIQLVEAAHYCRPVGAERVSHVLQLWSGRPH